MKKNVFLLIVAIVVALMSMVGCSKNYYIAGGSIPKKVMKTKKIYKSSYAADYTIKAYDIARGYQITSFDGKNVLVGKDTINSIYNDLSVLYDEYFTKEYDNLTKKMGKGFIFNNRGFVLIETKPWKIMKNSSLGLANQFNLYITAVMTEVNKNATKTYTKNVAFNGASFRAIFIDDAIIKFLLEYTTSSRDPIITKGKNK